MNNRKLLLVVIFTCFLSSNLFSQETGRKYITFSLGLSVPTAQSDFSPKYNEGFHFNAGFEKNFTGFLTSGVEGALSYYSPTESYSYSVGNEYGDNRLLHLRVDAFLKLQNNSGTDKFQPYLKAGAGYSTTNENNDLYYYDSFRGSGGVIILGNGFNYIANKNLKFSFSAEYNLYFIKRQPGSSVQFTAGVSLPVFQ